jgi:hypothetical protein
MSGMWLFSYERKECGRKSKSQQEMNVKKKVPVGVNWLY